MLRTVQELFKDIDKKNYSMNILFQFPLGFIIALSGALIPGPLLVGTIRSTLKNGKRAGFFASMGHVFVEIGLIIAIVVGVTSIILSESVQVFIGIVGGLLLLIIGIITLNESKKIIQINHTDIKDAKSGLKTGVTFTLCNPSFLLWWASVGITMLLSAYYSSGLLGVLFWVLGHFCADIIWFSSVSIMVYNDKSIIGKRPHQYLIFICGIVMMTIGVLFLFYNGKIVL